VTVQLGDDDDISGAELVGTRYVTSTQVRHHRPHLLPHETGDNMKITAESPGRGIPALPVPWNLTTWQHTAERADAVLSEVEQAVEGGSVSTALLGAVSSLAQACAFLASTELAVVAIGERGYQAGWRDGQQAQARPRKRGKRKANLRLVR
jgi:hypothetical protein